ncbi:MAG: exonuclease SbcCD subunit D [Bacteroidota bacterium]
MKLLHTADWHLGKLFHAQSLTQDQSVVLQQFLEHVKDAKPDAILIAGDIYDRSVPPKEAVEVFDWVLEELILNFRIPVIAIAGNHDSPERIDFGSKLLQKQRLHIFGKPSLQPKADLYLEDRFGKVYFYPFPFIEPANLRFLLDQPEGEFQSHEAIFRWFAEEVEKVHPFPARSVCLAHPFVTGVGEKHENAADAERRISVGGQYRVPRDVFSEFSYTALGHLHSREALRGQDVHYSGSLMKYSFAESHHEKSVTLVELDERGTPKLNFLPLSAPRDVRYLKGKIERQQFIPNAAEELPKKEDFLIVELENEGLVLHALSIIQESYPNAVGLRDTGNRTQENTTKLDLEQLESHSPEQLFETFYEEITGQKMDDTRRRIIQETVREVEQE